MTDKGWGLKFIALSALVGSALVPSRTDKSDYNQSIKRSLS